MSWQAVDWALHSAPMLAAEPASTKLALVCLAWHSDPDGRNAFPSIATLATDVGVSARVAKRAVYRLHTLGLIRYGDQEAVAHYRADSRPRVYDLALELQRGDAHDTRRGDAHDHGVTPTTPGGVTPTTERGDVRVLSGVTPTTPKKKYLKVNEKGGVTPTTPGATPTPPPYSEVRSTSVPAAGEHRAARLAEAMAAIQRKKA